MPIAFITGISGFAGSHLADLLVKHHWQVTGTTSPAGNRFSNISHLGNRINVVECDIRDRATVAATIAECRPEIICHLAAKTTERETRTDPETAFAVTVLGTLNVLDGVMKAGLTETRIHIAGSSAEYGRITDSQNAITEDHALSPIGMYGVTKIAQSMAALQYQLAHNLAVIRTRAFNHTGPRQSADFSTPAFAKQIAEIEAGIRPPLLKVGDLSQRRDLSDVRDIVRGYYLATTQGTIGQVYNIAAGTSVQIQDVLDRLIAMSSVKIQVAADPERMRPTEVAVQLGDSARLRNQTGWQPQIPLEQTLADTLDYWRKTVARSK